MYFKYLKFSKNKSQNYGILFTAWGVGGVVGPMLAGAIADGTGSYALAYNTAGVLLACAALLAMLSYVTIAIDAPAGQVTIKIGKGVKAA